MPTGRAVRRRCAPLFDFRSQEVCVTPSALRFAISRTSKRPHFIANGRGFTVNSTEFHDQEFDQSTLLKLQFFRGYIRKWLPVFLANRQPVFSEIHIYDFFCGPGTDPCGTEGSPLVILDEIDKLLREKASVCRADVKVFVHFNDQNSDKVHALQSLVSKLPLKANCTIIFTHFEFSEAFEKALPTLYEPCTANLLSVDQFGWKAISGRVFEAIIACPSTDLLFFISSSFVRRFSGDPSVTKYLPVQGDELAAVPGKEVHRFLCDRVYRPLIPAKKEYYLAPFSIRKDGTSNIYGLIFGSGKLLGLKKFLEVCWASDQISGEANYDIDDDIVLRSGEYPLLPEDKVAKKRDRFEKELRSFLGGACKTNRDVFKFTLESGFLPKDSTEIITGLQKFGLLKVEYIQTSKAAGRNTFYIDWKYYREEPRVRFIC